MKKHKDVKRSDKKNKKEQNIKDFFLKKQSKISNENIRIKE